MFDKKIARITHEAASDVGAGFPQTFDKAYDRDYERFYVYNDVIDLEALPKRK